MKWSGGSRHLAKRTVPPSGVWRHSVQKLPTAVSYTASYTKKTRMFIVATTSTSNPALGAVSIAGFVQSKLYEMSQKIFYSGRILEEILNVSVYHINTNKCTNVLLNHYIINTIRNCNMFQLLKGLLQGEQLIYTSSNVNKMSHRL